MSGITIDGLKAEARALRAARAARGRPVTHSQALEAVARAHGFRDWNTARARASDLPPPPELGQVVSGRYLGQAFVAEVVGVRVLGAGAAFRVSLQLAEAVDVVTFDSFSNWRRRVTGTIDASGRSVERTSDGTRHLVLDL